MSGRKTKVGECLLRIQPRFRIIRGKDIAFGPGKADLLGQIKATGSIAEAARELGMSYMRAWTLIKTMHGCFIDPLVEVSRGGVGHGGAKLTDTGEQVLKLYRELEKKTARATKKTNQELLKFLRQ